MRAFLRNAIDRGDRGFELAARELYDTHHNKLVDHIDHLNRMLAFAMLTGEHCAFPEKEDRYDALLRDPRFSESRLAFITLNYDTLLEDALRRSKRTWGYWGPRGLDGKPREVHGIPVFNIHGSVNWLRHIGSSGGGVGSTYAAVAAQRGNVMNVGLSGRDNTIDSRIEIVGCDRANAVNQLKHDHLAPPVLALYARDKPLESNYGAVVICRWACRAALRASPDAGVTVIGASVPTPADDHRFNWAIDHLSRLRGEKAYVGESDPQWERRGFNRVADTFKNFLT